jgi:hypothetical protein
MSFEMEGFGVKNLIDATVRLTMVSMPTLASLYVRFVNSLARKEHFVRRH